MVAHNYRQLDTWQLAVQFRDRTLAIIPSNPRFADRNLCQQLREAVESPPPNIAEGFGRFEPIDFARFVSIAIASLDEADTHLRHGVECGCFTAEAVAPLLVLRARCRGAAVSLRRYLRTEGKKKIAAWKRGLNRRTPYEPS